jgi:hypothetical protein
MLVLAKAGGNSKCPMGIGPRAVLPLCPPTRLPDTTNIKKWLISMRWGSRGKLKGSIGGESPRESRHVGFPLPGPWVTPPRPPIPKEPHHDNVMACKVARSEVIKCREAFSPHPASVPQLPPLLAGPPHTHQLLDPVLCFDVLLNMSDNLL